MRIDIRARAKELLDIVKTTYAKVRFRDQEVSNFENSLQQVIEENIFLDEEVVEDFENVSEEHGVTTFTSSGNRHFSIEEGDSFNLDRFQYFGHGSSNWYIDNWLTTTPNATLILKLLNKTKIKAKSIWIYSTEDRNDSITDTQPNTVNISLYLRGELVNSVVYDVAYAPGHSNGFTEADIEANYTGYCDEVRVQLLNGFTYLSVDQFTYIK